MALALFDFDGTITFRDSFAGFIKYTVGPTRFYMGVTCLAPVVAGFFLGLIPAWRAKELMSIFFFWGRDVRKFEELASKYSQEELPKIVREIARKRIEWHRERGDTVVVVSASIESWLKDWCEMQGIHLIATKLEVKGERISGRFLTKNCSGREKIRRIEERFDLSGFDYIYAYGDSAGDREMLALADEGYYRWKRVIGPSSPLSPRLPGQNDRP
jgi:phosphatidylglycerophosphatase C